MICIAIHTVHLTIGNLRDVYHFFCHDLGGDFVEEVIKVC